MKKQAIIFARVSSTNDRQNTKRQIEDLSRYAEANNLEICKIFEEHISGGVKNEDRPILLQAIEFCKDNEINIVLVSELSRIGRNVFEVLEIVKRLIDLNINLYIQKENFHLLEENSEVSIFAPILLASLSMCAQLERENIKYRLNSGRQQYKERGGKLGRRIGSTKTKQEKSEQYKGVIKRLKNGEKIRDIAILEKVGISTVQRIKKEFEL